MKRMYIMDIFASGKSCMRNRLYCAGEGGRSSSVSSASGWMTADNCGGRPRGGYQDKIVAAGNS